MSTPTSAVGNVALDDAGRLRRVDLVHDQVIDRQHDLALAQLQQFAGHVELVGLQPRVADVVALGLQEGVGHRAADQHAIDARQQGS